MRLGGIDPGLGGGIAVLDTEHWTLHSMLMPTAIVAGKKQVAAEEVIDFLADHNVKLCAIEAVWGMPGDAKPRAFNFGMHYGAVCASVRAVRAEAVLVPPIVWKRFHGLLKADKRQSLEKARKLFPMDGDQLLRIKDEGRAEAALIAAWLFETERERL